MRYAVCGLCRSNHPRIRANRFLYDLCVFADACFLRNRRVCFSTRTGPLSALFLSPPPRPCRVPTKWATPPLAVPNSHSHSRLAVDNWRLSSRGTIRQNTAVLTVKRTRLSLPSVSASACLRSSPGSYSGVAAALAICSLLS